MWWEFAGGDLIVNDLGWLRQRLPAIGLVRGDLSASE
jgi:hypothetical protein